MVVSFLEVFCLLFFKSPELGAQEACNPKTPLSTRQKTTTRKAYFLSQVVVQLLSSVWLFATPGTAAHQAPLSSTLSWSLLKFMSIESVMPSNHLLLCWPLVLLPSIFPCIRVFSNESVLYIKWPKYWNFSFSISASKEYLGLIFFRIDWFDLLAAQGTLKSLLQHHSSKATILLCSTFCMVQLLHLYMTTGKPITDYMDLCWQSDISAF